MIKLSDYKSEIIAAIFGAFTAGLLSLAGGLYSMNKNFQLTQNKELLFSLRTDITTLRKVERELDENKVIEETTRLIKKREVLAGE